jgi:hypothetical protein
MLCAVVRELIGVAIFNPFTFSSMRGHGATRLCASYACCAPKAVGSDGKPLGGAAKNSFMTKCVKEQG